MPISVTCTSCNRKLSAPDHAAGRQAKCPKCESTVTVPAQIEENPNLSACTDCGKPVSKRAPQCPNCGCPQQAIEAAKPGLVPCKACKRHVAESAMTCPECGVARPGKAIGRLVITRASAATAAMYPVQVFVDGKLAGEVKNGATLALELPASQQAVEVRGGGMSRKAAIDIEDGKTVNYQMYFSSLGVFGGGLNSKPA